MIYFIRDEDIGPVEIGTRISMGGLVQTTRRAGTGLPQFKRFLDRLARSGKARDHVAGDRSVFDGNGASRRRDYRDGGAPVLLEFGGGL